MADTIIYGSVDADGGILAGDGLFTVVHTKDTGLYTIFFDKQFNKMPAAAGKYLYTGVIGEAGVTTSYNVAFTFLDEERLKIKTGNYNGDPMDLGFTFVAVGD